MNTNNVARIASLVGEPARAGMLLALMSGRSLTANELAGAGNVTPQTASRHLAYMIEAGLLTMVQAGRTKYHRLASVEVAMVLEGIMQIAGNSHQSNVLTGPRDEPMRMARMCYDHIAGRLGLAITERLIADRAIEFNGSKGEILEIAEKVLQSWGMPLSTGPQVSSGNRPCCRPCMDWSERKYHVAGTLGKFISAQCFENGWLTRSTDSRVLSITAVGAIKFREILGLEAWNWILDAS